MALNGSRDAQENAHGKGIFNPQLALAFVLGTVFVTLAEYIPYRTVSGIVRGIGEAFFSATIVWGMFEFFAHRDLFEKISKNVFSEVLRRYLPKDLFDMIDRFIFRQDFVQKSKVLRYRLQDGVFDTRRKEENGDRFVEQLRYIDLEVELEYKIQNVSWTRKDWDFQFTLSNPFDDDLKKRCFVESIVIDDGMSEPFQAAERDFRARLEKENHAAEVPFVVRKIPVESNEEKSVRVRYRLAKKLDDTEFFQMMFPTDGISIHVEVLTDPVHLIWAESIHPVSLTPGEGKIELSSKHYSFYLHHYFLPYQGVRILWKRDPRIRTLPEIVETKPAVECNQV